MNSVYCLTNKINGKKYIGVGVTKCGNGIITQRWNCYKNMRCKLQPRLHSDILEKIGIKKRKTPKDWILIGEEKK